MTTRTVKAENVRVATPLGVQVGDKLIAGNALRKQGVTIFYTAVGTVLEFRADEQVTITYEPVEDGAKGVQKCGRKGAHDGERLPVLFTKGGATTCQYQKDHIVWYKNRVRVESDANGGIPLTKEQREQMNDTDRNRMLARIAERTPRTRDQMNASVLRGRDGVVRIMKGSQALKDSYRAAAMTALVAELRMTVDQAVALSGVEPWVPITWAEHRKAFPRKADIEEEIAA